MNIEDLAKEMREALITTEQAMASEFDFDAADRIWSASNRLHILAALDKAWAEIEDWKDCGEAAEHAPPDEKHCTCVPLLSKIIRDLHNVLDKRTKALEVIKAAPSVSMVKRIAMQGLEEASP